MYRLEWTDNKGKRQSAIVDNYAKAAAIMSKLKNAGIEPESFIIVRL